MRRRRLLGAAATTGLAAIAGCLGGSGDRGTTTGSLDPTQVTTTGGDDVEVVVAQVVIREDDEGPRINYRLRNGGEGDATVAVRTVLSIEGGGTYEKTAYADVSAGGEVVLEYPVVRYDELSTAEAQNVRRGDANFETYVNGERRLV